MGKAKGKALNDRQRAFVEHYLVCWNASEAARRAGYSKKTAREIGRENLTKPDIRAEIERRFAELGMGSDEVLARLASHARGSLQPFLQTQGENVLVDLTSDDAQAHLHLIKKIKTKKRSYTRDDEPVTETETEIEIHDPQTALVHLGRHWGLFIDKSISGEEVYREHMEKWANAITHSKVA